MTDIHDARQPDAPRLSTLFQRAWKEAGPGALGWTGATNASIEEIASEVCLAGLLANPKTKVLVAEEGGEIIGIAVLRRAEATVDELVGVILLETRTGRGVGRSLLEAAVERSRAHGATDMVVRTEASNDRALRFYERLGFVRESQVQEAVQGVRAHLVTLRRRLG